MTTHKQAAPSAKERILTAAAKLFYTNGVRAVGVEDILAQAGATKVTFYKYFRSKDDLVIAYVRKRDADWRAWLRETVERLSPAPATRPLAVFDAIALRLSSADFNGCAFTGCIFEFPDRNHGAHVAARDHKRAVTAYLTSLLVEANFSVPAELARELMILIDGAIVTVVREDAVWPAEAARRVAAVLLHDAQRGSHSAAFGRRDLPEQLYEIAT